MTIEQLFAILILSNLEQNNYEYFTKMKKRKHTVVIVNNGKNKKNFPFL